ncbi:MAG: ABC transporter ATP-binding protein [bacterium]
MIELRDVSFGYPDRLLFGGVNLSISRGEIILLKGRSGSGKTTLLRLLSLFLLPTGGVLTLDGRPYGSLRYSELRSRIVYLHQAPVIEQGKSLLENLLMPFSLAVHKGKKAPEEERIRSLLSEFRLNAELLRREAQGLSAGELQRAAIIRATLLRPEFLLLDEPVANLDPESAQAIRDWISRSSLENTGLVIVSHQPLEGISNGRDRHLELAEGKIHERRG